jgi:hypothetical protein
MMSLIPARLYNWDCASIHTEPREGSAIRKGLLILLLPTNRAAYHARGERLPGRRLNHAMRSCHRNPEPFGRSLLGEHIKRV